MPGSSSETDLKTRAQRHHYRSLTPEEYEGLNHFRADWANIAAEADDRFFILGSFSEDDVDRVNDLKAHINQETRDSAVAYRMDDFVPETDPILHPILKFKLIADDSHHILGVCEHDRSGAVNYPTLPRSGLVAPRLLRVGLPVSVSELARAKVSRWVISTRSSTQTTPQNGLVQ